MDLFWMRIELRWVYVKEPWIFLVHVQQSTMVYMGILHPLWNWIFLAVKPIW